jgi:tRNA A-37 threonylcarbamoyl transferase component Bud32/tetratricopeptide (TPR) repeat protein
MEHTSASGSKVEVSQTTLSAADSSAPVDAYVGKTIGDRYEVLEVVGKGGMGVVYKVRHKQLHKFLALKMLPSKNGLDRDQVARFDAEAKAASGLNHPNLAGIHDYGTTDDGSPYLVMDFVEGSSLAQRIASSVALTQEDVLKLFIQVCDGLDYAHRKRIIHRDIKPSNMMIAGSADKPVACIVDFGIAKEVRTDENTNGLTQTGMLIGSPQYMSPEQWSGQKADSRTDIYALGCALFEALTGQPPFSGNGPMQLMYKHINERPPLFKTVAKDRNISSSLERVVMQMLEKEPDNRYQSAADVKRDLELISQGKNPVKEVSQMRQRMLSLFKAARVCGQIALVAAITLSAVGAAYYSVTNASSWERLRQQADAQVRTGPNNYLEAAGYYQKALIDAKQHKAPAADIERILIEMSRLYGYLGWHDKSLARLDEAMTLNSSHKEDGNTGFILDEMAANYLDMERDADAEKTARRAIEVKRRQFGEVNWFTGHSISRLAQALRRLKKYDEAEARAREYVDVETKLNPHEDNSEVADAHHELGNILADEGKTDEAVKEADKTLALLIKMQGADSPKVQQYARWYIGYLKSSHREDHAAEIAKQVPGAE